MSWILKINNLFRLKVTAAVGFSTAAGYLLFDEPVTGALPLSMLGVFLLACGASGLNQVQEARIDARMERTRNRPIPAGQLDRVTAGFLAGLFILAGLYCLARLDRHLPALLGLAAFALLWYNGVYTYLKRFTPFAVLPGALVGAVPPLIGWSAAGGIISDPAIVLLAGFGFLWQIPHFWLLLLIYGPQYQSAGLPSLERYFTSIQARRIAALWISAVAVTGFWLGLWYSLGAGYLLVLLILAWALIWRSRLLLPGTVADIPLIRRIFVRLNLFALAILVIIIAHQVAR